MRPREGDPMNGMRKLVAVVLVCGTAGPGALAASRERTVDMAICLDTSGSMSGLINAARQKLWQIVSELATAKPTPRLRVALLTYGTPSYGSHNGFVRVDQELTDDLDLVYEKLMALGTRGGAEYVARVVKRAVDDLSWDSSARSLRIIFVAGNESAEQDPKIRNVDACSSAVERDIVVNAIYCGRRNSGDASGYRRVAELGKGTFAAIDQNRGTVVIKTPYDAELTRLSRELNGTYVAFGAYGTAGRARQEAQDANSAMMSHAAAAERAVAKSSKLYRNTKWDLVDALKKGERDLEKLADEELPAEMRAMSAEERKAYVQKKAQQRAEIQRRIKELSARRRKYVSEQMRTRSLSDHDSFDAAVRGAVRSQAEAKGFEF
jgi:hypothetical protein